MEERLISATTTETEYEVENALRPQSMEEYIGQEQIKENLKVFISSAKMRGDSLDHTLLYGPPGLGKTTLAHIIANELGVKIKVTSGPAIERAGDLASLLTNLEENDVLFIDEIHRLNHSVEEILYPAMEDFAIDLMIGKGPGANSVRLSLPHFTLIGATTKAGMLTSPLRDRFGFIARLKPYTTEELSTIVTRSAGTLGVDIDYEASVEISKRCRGTPRIANRLLKRVRDFALVSGNGKITYDITRLALERLEIDELGLDNIDIKLLTTLIKKFKGGPCGLDTISAAINEDTSTVEDVYEPYLLQLGFISRTPRGRVCLPACYEHLGLKLPKEKEMQLSLLEQLDDENAE